MLRYGKFYSETQILNLTSKVRNKTTTMFDEDTGNQQQHNPVPYDQSQLMRVYNAFHRITMGSTEVFAAPTIYLRGGVK